VGEKQKKEQEQHQKKKAINSVVYPMFFLSFDFVFASALDFGQQQCG